MKRAFRTGGKKGFTLLELLFALVLLSIIVGALYSTFFLSQRAIAGTEDSLLKLQECRKTMDALIRETDSSLYASANKYSVFKIEDRDFYGKQASRVTFTTFSPLRPGLSLVSYYVEEKDGRMTLFKTIGSPYKTEAENRGADVIEDIDAFTVEVKENNSWLKTWDSAEIRKVPEEVRFTLTVRIKDRLVTLYETVRPKIGSML